MTTPAIRARRPDLRDLAARLSWLGPLASLVLLQQIFFPAPMGIVLIGALVGGRIALIALGIALIYRANRVVNFAQGDLGAVPAVLGVMLVVAWGWSYWLGLVAGLLAAVVLGVLVEGLVIRRFFTAPRLILTVATIGLAELLTGLGLLLPRAFDNKSFGDRLPQPFDATWEFGGVTFNANDMFTMIVVPVCLLGLALFLQRSTIGIAIVGAAERADRAFTLGIPVKRLHTVVWVVASVLAFLAMFLRAGAVGLPIGEVLAPTFLVQALAAAVFGRFERFTTIAAAAIGLGIVDQAMTFQPGNKEAYNVAVLFAIVLVGLLLTRRGTGSARVDTDSSATWQATREMRPIPREMRHLPEVVWGRIGLLAVVVVFVLTLPLWLSTSRLNLATIIVIFGIVAASLVVLSGWAGQVSLGHMAFVGLGAFVGGALTYHRGWDLALALLLAGVVGGVAAVVVGFPALRRRGLTLAVSTLAFGLFVSEYLLNRTIPLLRDRLPGRQIDRGTLLGIDLDSETAMFYACLGILALALIMVTGIRRTRTGRVLIAIRENERAARSYGVDATRTTLAAFALSGFLAAAAGALYVHQQTGLNAKLFRPEASLELFTMVVIGGLGSLPGALLGATYVRSADFFLPVEWQFLATGAGVLLVLLVFPSGFGGVLADLRDGALRRIAARRDLVVPSLLADVRVEGEADAPPEETVLLEAAESAIEVEETDGASAPAPSDVVTDDPPDSHAAVTAPDAGGPVEEVHPVTTHDESNDAEQAADDILDGAAALDAIGSGDAGEAAAEIVRELSAKAVAQPGDGSAESTGGPWSRLKQRTTQGAPFYPLGVLFGLNMADELDRTAFGVLLPEIRDHFGLDTGGILTVVSLSLIAALILALPIGFYGDRGRRVRIAGVGGAVWSMFSLLTAAAGSVFMLGAARAGAGLGRGVNDPTHNSLLADYYDIPARPRVYAVHRYANALGQFLGPLLGGLIAFSLGWRAPFVVFAVVSVVFVVMTFRMREPIRGQHERRAMGVSAEVAETKEEPPSWDESWRIVWHVRTLRRLYVALPFVAVALVGLLTLSGLYYEEVFELDERARGFTSAGLEGGAQLFGLILGIPLTTRLMAKGPGNVVRFLGKLSFGIAAAWVAFAMSPTLPMAIAFNAVLSAALFLLVPGLFVTLSRAIPAKVRSFGYAVATLFVLPGLVVLPFIGWLADQHGIRVGLVAAAPVFIVGGLIIASAGPSVEHDIAQVWRSTAARSEVAQLRRQGKVKLLLGRQIDVHYDNVQVLFGVDFEVAEGEIVALMGTNGAGKSTLLKAIAGLVPASAGAVVFDGRDMTHTPPDEVAGRGVSVVPGGQGVFTQLSVEDNLRLAAWGKKRRGADVAADTERVLTMFPGLRDRLHEPAGNLSGGQQQMLTLGMAFIGKPRLLMIDELSLGLAPTVVGRLLEVVRELRDAGTTVILVEQSVNVALTVADRAYFMEKGEIRFEGPTSELLERPDLLRSVFLHAAAEAVESEEGAPLSHSAVEDGAVVLEVRDIVRGFGGVRALDGVSFDVRRGEILGFIGPNGAGKTTLFDVISGYTPADSGSIRLLVAGALTDLRQAPTHVRARRGLGRSFQDGRLFPGLTVHEAIAVALEQHVDVRDPVAASLHLPSVQDSEEKVKARVDELIDLLALDAYRDKFVRELSTGTRRVVDLACVLAQGPSVVLLDEPSSGIAQREAEALAPMLRRVRDHLGASLLVIEHDLPLLGQLCDRMLALDLGHVVAEGPAEVVEHPAVVASYLGTDETAITRSGAPAPSP